MKATVKNPPAPRHQSVEPTRSSPIHKGGRPRKKADGKKTKRLSLHLTPGEAATFEAAYQQHKLSKPVSRNEFAKGQIFNPARSLKTSQKSEGILPVRNFTEEINQVLRLLNVLVVQLKAIGINYNQSVKRLNGMYLAKEVRAEITQQVDCLSQLTNLLTWSHEIQHKMDNLLANKEGNHS